MSESNFEFNLDEEFLTGETRISPEQRLYIAVIINAFYEANMKSRNPFAMRIRAEARDWLLTDSEDRTTVFAHAGLNIENINMKKIEDAISRAPDLDLNKFRRNRKKL